MSKEKKNVHEIEIKMEGETWKKALDKSFKKNVKNVEIKGFRKGKCPRDIYIKNYGEQSLYGDAVDDLLQDAYTRLLDENKELVPVVQPKVDLKNVDDTGVTYLFTIITKPDVIVKKYKDLGVKKEEVEVTDDEIQHEIGHLLEHYTDLVVKEDGEVENGDIAVIDFEGLKDGVPFDGGKGENYSLEIGSNTFIPGFEEQLIGMKKEEEKDVALSFPDDYGVEDLAGQPVIFKVKVHEIKTKEKPELDEDFFEDLDMEGVNSEETLKEELKKNIKAQKELDAENIYLDQLLEAIGKNTEVDIPEEMVEEETERLLRRVESSLNMQGVSLDLYYQMTGSKEEDLKNQLEKEAYQNVLYRLALEEVMNQEKIEVTMEEAEEEAEKLAEKYQMEKEDFLTEFGGIELVQYDLEMRKTIELLKEYNQ